MKNIRQYKRYRNEWLEKEKEKKSNNIFEAENLLLVKEGNTSYTDFNKIFLFLKFLIKNHWSENFLYVTNIRIIWLIQLTTY